MRFRDFENVGRNNKSKKKSLVHLHGSLNISLHGSLNMHPYLFVHLIHTKEIYLKTYMIQKLLFLILIFQLLE
jgi:hypothetical protein